MKVRWLPLIGLLVGLAAIVVIVWESWAAFADQRPPSTGLTLLAGVVAALGFGIYVFRSEP